MYFFHIYSKIDQNHNFDRDFSRATSKGISVCYVLMSVSIFFKELTLFYKMLKNIKKCITWGTESSFYIYYQFDKN